MRIKITEETIKLNIGGNLAVFHKDDEVTVDEDVGLACLTHGWATDLDGGVESGVRKPGSNGPLEIQNVTTEIS